MAKYQLQTVVTASAARLGVGKRLMGFILFGGSAASSVEFKNAETDTGTVLLSYNVAANTSSPLIDLTELGGIEFSTAIFCKPAGTAAIVYAWFE
jgi:hypothetical protein